MLSDLARQVGARALARLKRAMVMDVKRAFLYGMARRRIYLRLPKEGPEYGKGKFWRLSRSMYGTRDAPRYGRQ